jgi:hypothetical protein
MNTMARTEIDIELLLMWAYRDELSKRRTSSAEGIWDRIQEDGQRGGIDPGHGAAQRYSHFGLPDPDAELIEKAVSSLEDTVIDWPQSFNAIAGELSGLISVNEMAAPESQQPRSPKTNWGNAGTKALKAWWGPEGAKPVRDRPRDVLMVGGLRTAALVTMHAIKGVRPDWNEYPPRPRPTPAVRGPNAMVFGECKGRNLYSLGAHCPLQWSPSPMMIVSSRAEYVAWHSGLVKLAETLQLAKFKPLPPRACETPWLEDLEPQQNIRDVDPAPGNSVSLWGTLPLAPARGRKLSPLRSPKAGPVRYPLEGEVA